jgi:hypothetical protein
MRAQPDRDARSDRSASTQALPASLPDPIDIVSEMVYGLDILAVCSWGPRYPEIQIFRPPYNEAPVTVDTPGSMFDIDLWVAWDTNLYVSACGKHVHAGTSGRGGDLYLLMESGGGAVDPASPAETAAGPRAFPNPSAGARRIDFRLAQSGAAALNVHDVAGRVVARLFDEPAASGPHSVMWNGRDLAGRQVPAGTYFVTLQADGRTSTGRVILIR